MSDDSKRDIANRVALRYFVASSGTELSTVVQNGATKARLAAEKLQDSLNKGMALINDSPHKEAIYAEAGGLLTEVQGLMDEIYDGLAIVSYASAKVEQKKLKNEVPARIREQIDNAVKTDT